MRERGSTTKSLAGQLLLASPGLRDPNFRRTVILLSSHGPDGAMGVVLNRPLGRQLGELNADFAMGPLAGVPLYSGGPVETKQLILAAWRWIDADDAFQLHFALEPAKAAEMIGTPGLKLRAFLGYSGWGKGQLDKEMRLDTWFTAAVDAYNLDSAEGTGLWRLILGSLDPELKLLADEPEDPTVN